MTLVLHIVTRTNIGGVSNYLSNVISATGNEIQHAIVRGTPATNEGDFFADHAVGAKIIDLPSLQRALSPWKELVTCLALVRIIRAMRPDIVHTHMAKAGVLGRLTAWLCRVPIRIHTFHGHLLNGYFSSTAVRVIVFVEKALQRITSWSITNGERVRLDLIDRKILTDKHSVSIPPAVQPFTTISKQHARHILALPIDGHIVGFVGRLAEVKRPDRFLMIAAAFPETTFVMFGDGPLGDEVRKKASFLPNLVMKGWVTDVITMYSAIDVLILTSDNEAAAVVLIEAAIAGIPAIAMNVGSVSEVVLNQQTGLLIDDERDLIPATKHMLDDSSLRNLLGQNARRHALREFNVEKLANQHLVLYKK